ncbi:MAG: MotA/TolQ/ExbB proton channel family protein [Sphingomonadaceae bacterium]
MIIEIFDDPLPALFVFAGTVAALFLRSGWRGWIQVLYELSWLVRPPFDKAQTKASLSAYIQARQAEGHFRAEPKPTGDSEFDHATNDLAKGASLDNLLHNFEYQRRNRKEASDRSCEILSQGAEIAPAIGLAGTLLSMGELSVLAAHGQPFVPALGDAIATTLYGLVLAHFLFTPLAGAIARKARLEDQERESLMSWLSAHVTPHDRRTGYAPPASVSQHISGHRAAA